MQKQHFIRKKKKVKSSHEGDDVSSFSCLPDEILLEILRKIIDLKTLCTCKRVSKRFCRVILQVDTIFFITKPNISLRSFAPAIRSLQDFGGLKSLSIEFTATSYEYVSVIDDPSMLFKWKIKFGNKLDSLIFLSPNSLYRNKELYVNANGHKEEEEQENKKLTMKKHQKVESCLAYAMVKHYILLICIKNIPLLENVSFTSNKRWRVAVSGRKVAEMRNKLSLPSNIIRNLEFDYRMSKCYVPLLELPVSGYVMKGVTLFFLERDDLPDGTDSFPKCDDDDDFEDKEEAAYSEAMMEIFKHHMGRMVTLSNTGTVLL